MISKTLTWTTNDSAMADAQYLVTELERTLNRAQQTRQELPASIALYTRMRATLAEQLAVLDTANANLGPVIHPQYNYIEDTINHMRRNAASLESILSSRESDEAHIDERVQLLEQRLNSARMALARVKPPTTVTLHAADMRKALSRIGAKNIRLHEDTRATYKRIEATFDDIVLTPADVGTLPFWVKCVGTNTPSVRLPPLKVAVHPTTQNIFAKRLRGVTGYISGFSHYPVAHPHVTSGNGALCLGDWGDVLMESIDQQDWTMTFDVLKQFLRSANHQDAAGKTWVNYLSRGQNFSLNQTLVDSWRYYPQTAPRVCNLPNGTSKYGYLIFTGSGNFEWFLHDKPNEWPDISIKTLDAPPATIITELPENEELADADPNEPWRDDEGYDQNGYNEDGFNRAGYNRDGYNDDGYDEDGYNEYGYNEDGIDRDGYDEYGYNEDGYDREGYNENGYNEDGFNRDGFNRDGVHYSEAA